MTGTTRINNTTGTPYRANPITGRSKDAGLVDKIVGKTEQKIGQMKRDPIMQQEGAIRAYNGKAAAEIYKEGVYSGSAATTRTAPVAPVGQAAPAAPVAGTMGSTRAVGTHGQAYGGTQANAYPVAPHTTVSDKIIGATESKIGQFKNDAVMQQAGEIRAHEGKIQAQEFKASMPTGHYAMGPGPKSRTNLNDPRLGQNPY